MNNKSKFAGRKDKSNSGGMGIFDDGTLGGTYSRSASGEGGYDWNSYAGLQGTSGDATWSTSGLSKASSEGGGAADRGQTLMISFLVIMGFEFMKRLTQ